jgi:thiol-disulfide isomerase/thioredoxin
MMREVGPRPVPQTAVETLRGDSFDFGAQDGRVLLINVWATWCAPCRKEIPDLVALQKELPTDQFTVVGISVDREGAPEVEPFVEKYDVSYPIVLDPEQTLAPEFGAVQGLPTTFIVNAEGQIVRRVLGLVSIDELRPELERMMEGA